jgi:hypothetical protein
MEIFGKIVEILSETHLLLKLDKTVEAQGVLTVYSNLEVPALHQKYGLSAIRLPKGQVRVISEQANGLYLAESFREAIHRPALQGVSLLAELLSQQTTLGPPSAEFAAPTVPVELTIDKQVQVGDAVGTT